MLVNCGFHHTFFPRISPFQAVSGWLAFQYQGCVQRIITCSSLCLCVCVCVCMCVCVCVWFWVALQFALQDLKIALANTPSVHLLFVLYCIVYYKCAA